MSGAKVNGCTYGLPYCITAGQTNIQEHQSQDLKERFSESVYVEAVKPKSSVTGF